MRCCRNEAAAPCHALCAATAEPTITPPNPRLFVALELPPALRQRLAGLPMALPGLRRVPPQQLHLTLRFIGTGRPVADLCAALTAVQAPSLALALSGVGRWPGVLWAGLQPSPAPAELQQCVNQALATCGLAPETRPFRPHITLARFPARRPPPRLNAWLRAHRALRTPPVSVQDFCLYASELTPAGARYRILQRFPLRAGRDA